MDNPVAPSGFTNGITLTATLKFTTETGNIPAARTRNTEESTSQQYPDAELQSDKVLNVKYVDAVLAGKISPDEILDYRTAWDSTSGEVSLHEFLGLTWSEYAMWVHDDRNLEYIFAARRGGKSLRQHLEDRRGADQIADELYKMSDFYDWD